MPDNTESELSPGEFIFTVVLAVALTFVVHPLLMGLILSTMRGLHLIDPTEDLIVLSLIAYPLIFAGIVVGLAPLVRDRNPRRSKQRDDRHT